MTTRTATAIDCTGQPVDAALWLARAFVDGRRLAVAAPGGEDHAHHVAVEFVHPAIAGTRSLPAIVTDAAEPVAESDALLVIGDAAAGGADLVISADRPDVDIVRSYHVLWELVQVALEHPGLVGADAPAGGDATGFLYPFLDAAEHDEAGLRADLQVSAAAKRIESDELVAETVDRNRSTLTSAAAAMVAAIDAGCRVLTMGNGGSACDAARLARLLIEIGAPTEPLAADYAVLTALANDVGVDKVFARQVEAFGRAGDALVGCSTSGASANLLAAFDRAAAQGLTTVGLSGYGGESFTDRPSVHHSLVVRSPSVHRIQEAEAALLTQLVAKVRSELGR